MRMLFALLAVLTLVGTATAGDIAKGPVVIEGEERDYQDQMQGGSALIISILEGTFTDLAPIYQTGFADNGVTADIIYDPFGAWDPSMYDAVLMTTSDKWWDTYDYGPDFMVASAYIDGGGCMFVVGQDFLYSSGPYGGLGFLQTYFGVISVFEDVNFGDASPLQWIGLPGSVLDGLIDTVIPCFEANPWFTDDVTATVPIADWSGGGFAGQAGSQTETTLFSVVEFACGTIVGDVVGAMLTLCGEPPNAIQQATWGQIKSHYH